MREEGRPVRIIILKARQEGISTGVASWIFAHLLCQAHARANVVAHSRDGVVNLFEMYDIYYRNLPEPLQKPCRSYKQERRMRFEDEGRLDVQVAKESASDEVGTTGRSRNYHFSHWSEVAMWRNARTTARALGQTISDYENTALFMESTSAGYGGYFYEQWQRVEEGVGEYRGLFLPWFIHEEYARPFSDDEDKAELKNTICTKRTDKYGDERKLIEEEKFGLTLEQLNWRRHTIDSPDKCAGDLTTFMREYPATPDEAFQAASDHIFKPGKLQIYLEKAVPPKAVGILDGSKRNVLFKDDSRGYLRIWEPPEPFVEYVGGSDHAEGLDSGDWNSALVIRRLPLRIVARLQGRDGERIAPGRFAELMKLLGEYYNNMYWNPENNNQGATVTFKLQELGYPFVMNEKQMDISSLDRLGWRNKTPVRSRVIDLAIDVVNNEMIDIPDKKMLKQLRGMAKDKKSGKIRARRKGTERKVNEPKEGYYDDMFFALGGALLANLYLPEPKAQKQKKAEEDWQQRLNEYERNQQGHEDAWMNYV